MLAVVDMLPYSTFRNDQFFKFRKNDISKYPSADPIETPSVCWKSWLLNENAVLVQESRISFFKVRFERVVATSFPSKTRSRMTLIVLVSATFVNSETTSNETRR